jgi:Zn-dependent protease
MDFGFILAIILKLSILVFSIIVHEVAHGYVAYKLGDPTAKMSDRLSLNPINHIDPIGSVILPLFLAFTQSGLMLGWAKPVPVDARYFTHPRRDDFLVSIAGVTANFAIAAIAGLLFRVTGTLHIQELTMFLTLTCVTNIGLAVFNLLPVPPLDGSHVAAALMPLDMARRYMDMARFGFLIILLLLYLGFIDRIMIPVMGFLLWILLGVQPW